MLPPPLWVRPEVFGMDEPSAQLALGDRLIAGVLLNVGWILLLIGLEPVGARLITGAKIYSVAAVFVLTALGLLSLVAGIAWPPSSQEVRTLLTPVITPIARNFVWILMFFITGLWLVNAIPVYRAGDIAALRTELLALRADFERYVAPRQLSPSQAKTITDYLSKFDRHEYIMIVAKNDPEALNYYGGITSSLWLGGWKATKMEYADEVPEGLGIWVEYTGPIPPQPDPRRKLEPEELLAEAFRKANVLVNNSGASFNRPQYIIYIKIGHRPLAIDPQKRQQP
jgi:hypothetical protein